MGRIKEIDRLPIVDAYLGHWNEADAIGTPFEIVTGYGRPELVADRDAYHDKGEEIADLETGLAIMRAERDALFGTSPNNEQGIWFRLSQYKSMVRVRMGTLHPLARTVPNIGNVTRERYLSIIHRFIDHWERVDAALASPMTLGALTLTGLRAVHDEIELKAQAVQSAEEAALPLARAERERMFGDLPEDERDDESIISRLQLYAVTVQAMFPGQPIALSLPEIFPGGSSAPPLPTFRFNWVPQPGGELKTWLEVPTLPEADVVFLKEGAFEDSVAFDPAPENGIQVITWSGVTIVDELDEFEIRSADGTTLARGQRDTSLPEPVEEPEPIVP